MDELNATSDDPLDVEMSGSRGQPHAVGLILAKAADLMQQMPDGTRYDFELSITERETTEKEENNDG